MTATMTAAPPVTISLEIACSADCAKFAWPLYRQLAAGDYTWPMSVLPLDGFAGWLESLTTARKRAARCAAHGYAFTPFARHEHVDAIHAINTSLRERQGRPMSTGYLNRPVYGPDEYTCRRHRINPYGIFSDTGKLVAYAFIYRSGELALVSQILGHGDHLDQGVMHLLLRETVWAENSEGGFLVYNRHDSGRPGLRQFKEWFRFRPTRIEWSL